MYTAEELPSRLELNTNLYFALFTLESAPDIPNTCTPTQTRRSPTSYAHFSLIFHVHHGRPSSHSLLKRWYDLFALANPALNRLPHAGNRLIDLLLRNLGVYLGHVDTLLDALAGPDVRIRHGGELLLVLPRKSADVVHGDGEDGPGSAETESKRGGATEDNAAVARNDAAGHTRDENVDEAGHEALAALAGRGEAGDGGGEGVLEIEGASHAVVDSILGDAGLVVEEEAGTADLGGQTVGGGRATGGVGAGEDVDEAIGEGLLVAGGPLGGGGV